MKTVLLTGPIGSGKSAVSAILKSKGYPVYDCDSRCKALYDEVPGLKKRIEEVLGVPFEALSVIFEDESRRRKLSALVYPLLLQDIERWKNSLNGCDTCFVESAVASGESLFAGVFDAVWLVTAPLGIRLQRNPKVAGRDSLQDFSGLAPNIVIENDGTMEELKTKIDEIL